MIRVCGYSHAIRIERFSDAPLVEQEIRQIGECRRVTRVRFQRRFEVRPRTVAPLEIDARHAALIEEQGARGRVGRVDRPGQQLFGRGEVAPLQCGKVGKGRIGAFLSGPG